MALRYFKIITYIIYYLHIPSLEIFIFTNDNGILEKSCFVFHGCFISVLYVHRTESEKTHLISNGNRHKSVTAYISSCETSNDFCIFSLRSMDYDTSTISPPNSGYEIISEASFEDIAVNNSVAWRSFDCIKSNPIFKAIR